MAGGPPRKDFDWFLVESLAQAECSEEFIARKLVEKDGVPVDQITFKNVQAKIKLLQRRIKERWDCSFVQFRDKMLEGWRQELRNLQKDAARKGNTAMLVWLGKQYLGQTDKLEQKQEVKAEVTETVYKAKWGGTNEPASPGRDGDA